jgi:hypothetical protein
VRASAVIPVLVPTLTAQPVSASNAKALAALVTIAGASISKRLVSILKSLSLARSTQKDEEDLEEIDKAIFSLFASIDDLGALNSVLMHLLSLCKDPTPAKRVEGCHLFAHFCNHATTEHSDYDADWIRQLVSLFDDRSEPVVQAAWDAMTALVKTADKEELEKLSVPLRRTVENTGTAGHPVPGFCLPSGIKPILRKSSPFGSSLSLIVPSYLPARPAWRHCRTARAVCLRPVGSRSTHFF